MLLGVPFQQSAISNVQHLTVVQKQLATCMCAHATAHACSASNAPHAVFKQAQHGRAREDAAAGTREGAHRCCCSVTLTQCNMRALVLLIQHYMLTAAVLHTHHLVHLNMYSTALVRIWTSSLHAIGLTGMLLCTPTCIPLCKLVAGNRSSSSSSRCASRQEVCAGKPLTTTVPLHKHE